MKFYIEKTDLLGALSTVQKALPTRTTNILLEGIYIKAQDTLTLMCCNGAIQIETYINAKINETGCYVFPGRLFCEIIRKFPEGEICIEVKEKDDKLTAKIVSNSSKTTIQCMNAQDFPTMPSTTNENVFQINQALLKDMIKQTIFACAQDEVRPILTGILFNLQNNCLNLVALDGYRLAIRKENIAQELTHSAIIPASSLSEIAKTLVEDDSNVSISFSQSGAIFNLEHTKINTVLLSGEYSKYQQIIPTEHSTFLNINRKNLLNSIELASLMARESKNNLICFQVQSDALVITSNSEVGNVYESINANISGNELEIAFNAKYMQDVLSKLEDETITMRFNSNISPCTIEPLEGEKFLYLVLPVRMFNR